MEQHHCQSHHFCLLTFVAFSLFNPCDRYDNDWQLAVAFFQKNLCGKISAGGEQ